MLWIRKKLSNFRQNIGVILCMALAFLVSNVVKYGCAFRHLTGIPCPGCGLSRAFYRLLRLDIAGAFYYHPLFWLAIIFLVIFFFGDKPYFGTKKRELVFIIVVGVPFILVWLYRLLFSGQSEFGINIGESLIYEVISHFR